MRTRYTAFALVIANAASAQLLNGSFENDAFQGDLSYWEHNCLAQSAADAAPFSGLWSAEVEASNPQGCFPGWLYQEVPWAYPGMPFSLGGWCRNTGGPWAPQIGLDIGVMDIGGNGTITPLNLGTTISDTVWTWMSFEDTLELALEQQAVVICNPGIVGGPAVALARFDGIHFFETFPFGVQDAPALYHYYDVANGSLHIASSHGRIHGVHLLDMTGRILPTKTRAGNSTTVHVDLGSLPTGVYIAAVRTDRGDEALRFVVR